MPRDEHVHRPQDGKGARRRLGREVAHLAGEQHGVVSRAQLVDRGIGHDAVDGWIAARRLLPVRRGVYAVGHRLLTVEGRWMAAVLAGGTGAVLSHLSAADLWELTGLSRPLAHVTVARRRRPRHAIVFHRASLPPDERTLRAGIPVTTVARTLLDAAAILTPVRLQQAVSRAEALRLADAPSLPELLERHPRRRGSVALTEVLADSRLGLDLAESELEIEFAEFVRARGLPAPELNAPLEVRAGRRVADCLWREAGLAVELDSRRHHANARAFEGDRARDLALLADGWVTVRVTARRLRRDADALERELRAALSKRRGAR